MIRIAICDDDTLAIGAIRGAVEKAFADERLDVEVSEYVTPRQLQAARQRKHFDLLLLDIDMPEINGIEFGERLRREKDDTDIVYVSSCENRVFEAMQIQPKGFIRKSHFFSDLQRYAKILAENYRTRDMMPSLIVNDEGASISIPFHQIIYIECSLKQQFLYTALSKRPYILKKSMKFAEQLTAPYGLIRIHASYLVNYHFISVFGKSEVVLRGGERLPLSKSHAHEAKEKYLELMRQAGNIML